MRTLNPTQIAPRATPHYGQPASSPMKRLPASYAETLIAIVASLSCYFLGMSLFRNYFGDTQNTLWAIILLIIGTLVAQRAIFSSLFWKNFSPLMAPIFFLLSYKCFIYLFYGLPQMVNPIYFVSLGVSFLFLVFALAQGRQWQWAIIGFAAYGTVLLVVGWLNLYAGTLSVFSPTFQFIVPLILQPGEIGGSYQHEGRFLTIAAICFVALALYGNGFGSRLLGFLVALSFLPLLSAVGARSAFVALIVATALLVVSRYRMSKPLVALLFIGTLILTIAILFPATVAATGAIADDSLVIRRLTILWDLENDVSARLGLWTDALSLWLSSPISFLFGLGPNGYQRAFSLGPGQYPHNIFLELCVEYGIIGLSLWIFLFWRACAKRFSSIGKMSISQASVNGIFIVVFVHFLFTGGLHTTWPLLFLAATVGLANQDPPSGARSNVMASFAASRPVSASVQSSDRVHL